MDQHVTHALHSTSGEPRVSNQTALEIHLRCGYKLIHFSSLEELRAMSELRRVAQGLGGGRNRALYAWAETSGLVDYGTGQEIKNTASPEKALQWIIERESGNNASPAIYILKDIHPFINSRTGRSTIVRKLKDTVLALEPTLSAIVLLSGPQLEIPAELEKDLVIIDFDLPTIEEISAKYSEMVSQYRQNPNLNIQVGEDDITALARAAQGLTLAEAELAFGKAIAVDRQLDASDVSVIIDEKRQIVRKSGILTFENPGKMGEVGGLENLKAWLEKRKGIFSQDARRYGLTSPKGVMLTGVPGCGKSLCARAMASIWGIPILRLDMGAVFGGLVGQSEANIRKAIKAAEAMAPCILMIDEIEKGLAGTGGSGDGGTATRVFGNILSWMSDKTASVFVVATANEFDRLPPEMLRKGRFDEIFFVDFPHEGEREAILRIHVQKAFARREPKPGEEELAKLLADFNFDGPYEVQPGNEELTGSLVAISRDLTGAEIEQAVLAGMIEAFNDGMRPLEGRDVAICIARTVPLIDTMRQRITTLRERAKECTVWASKEAGSAPVGSSTKLDAAPTSPTTPPRHGGRGVDF
jgi:SpoVK/Ycf46/Vps4 family AAA+-type ATPase